VPILAVLADADTFSMLWRELADAHGLELLVARTAGELSPAPELLAPLLLIAGREGSAELEIQALLAGGFAAPLVVGASTDHRLSARMLKAGAADYFALPPDLDLLRSTLEQLVLRQRARSDRLRLLEAARAEYDFSQIVGRSDSMRGALERVARIIPHDRATVLVTGETGTGKELIARAIHFNGSRAHAPFVEINCAAIPGNLLESELFGYERGAFTDARTSKPGLFEAAEGGTLFLDEIGHLPLPLQGKLLKGIEEKRVRRLGSLQSRDIDLRIIAATHVDLAASVRRGEFREDLYYRLATIPIHLPPLRERGDDVLLIARHLLQRLGDQYGLLPPTIDAGLRRRLLGHPWPGNVRELRNSLERALLLGGDRLDPADLFLELHPAPAAGSVLPFPAPLAEIEKQAAVGMVNRLNGNKSAAAAALGISRSRLYRLLDGEEAEDDIEPAMPLPSL
jgi:DNA-binding NtrC family response regulator